ILGAAAVLFAAGGVLAITKPGNLGDDDVSAEATSTTVGDATTTEGTTSTTVDGDGSTTTVDPAGQPTDTTAPGGVGGVGGSGTGSTGAPAEPEDGTTTSTIAGSGMAGGGTPTGGV